MKTDRKSANNEDIVRITSIEIRSQYRLLIMQSTRTTSNVHSTDFNSITMQRQKKKKYQSSVQNRQRNERRPEIYIQVFNDKKKGKSATCFLFSDIVKRMQVGGQPYSLSLSLLA